jgi:YD repeat-containing protein
VSYAGYYYDGADRLTSSVNVGTNGGVSWTRPTVVPARSDTVLRTDRAYDASGWMHETVDPMGRSHRTEYDRLGRTVWTFENYVDGVVGSDNDKKTEYGYGPAGMTSLRAYTTDTASQTTQWNYGFTTGNLMTNDAVS